MSHQMALSKVFSLQKGQFAESREIKYIKKETILGQILESNQCVQGAWSSMVGLERLWRLAGGFRASEDE